MPYKKKDNPTRIEDYRPIACCNVIYMILSKVTCNKMKKILPNVVAICQSEFIKGRSISKNSSLAHELIRNFNKQGADKLCLKVDLHKAYNKIK